MSKTKTKGGGQKLSDKDMEAHREYMKKYKMQSSDLERHEVRYKDHYELLGIPRDASHTEIRKAYRKLALRCHPDRKPSAEALARWEGVPAAYAVLSDPNDRTEYDATLPTRDALVEFYRAYNPAKLDNDTIQTIIDGWYGREVELFEMLNAKYEVAPHQGTTKSAQRAAAVAVSREKTHKIAMDSQTYKSKDAANAEITWPGTIGSAFCCKGVFSRMFSTTYYEVDTTSPGFLGSHGASDTPGQAMSMNLESPATPSQLSKPVSPEFDPPVDAENLSNATTVDGSPPSGDENCARTGSVYGISPPAPRAAQPNAAAAS
ncbi:hypothetical protein PF005_g13062 [Phytophthora fragariae]|uniref:J domain-containing protein n=2 Tax=Phytophthora fragariae TaxID=53985 RepID=A0A6A3TXE2_9STRA|nr:hypothetical protein PF003_g14 [Phytophthora fragariae]KAE8939499.1 hypothetical protein PF009_g10655 [Phytophthora fragariae]KAE9005646.1 hypothetical protein PF011_g11948 [Phytophthora fragariae]KAE9104834.1 hypothetical protein PF010_g13241 [Phytophthora fragariae]KAE9107236.1 hypothetical protein PF007_g13112 [Phytophthora fragariae]